MELSGQVTQFLAKMLTSEILMIADHLSGLNFLTLDLTDRLRMG